MSSESKYIDITASAREHIRAQVAQQQAKFLRLGVKESGCNGYMYTLDFLTTMEPTDVQVEIDEHINICIRRDDLALVDGTEMDLVTKGLNSNLVFKNSRAQSYCGCGESFALGDTAVVEPDTQYGESAATLAHDASALN